MRRPLKEVSDGGLSVDSWIDAEQHADRALELYERGQLAEAEAELLKALAIVPEQAEWSYNLGLTLEAAGRDGEAVEAFDQCAKQQPGTIDPLLAAATVAGRGGDSRGVMVRVEKALKIDPRCEEAYIQKIEACGQLGLHEEAELTFHISQMALSSPSVGCLMAVAEVMAAARDHARAIWCLQEVLKLHPETPMARARLASVHAAKGQVHRATGLYLRELRDHPNDILTRLDFAELLLGLGRDGEAIKHLEHVLKIDPANIDAHEHLGFMALRQGRADEAVLLLSLVMRLGRKDPPVQATLAQALLACGKVSLARRHTRRCLHAIRSVGSTQRLTPMMHHAAIVTSRLLLQFGYPEDAVKLCAQLDDRRWPQEEVLQIKAAAHFAAGQRRQGVGVSRRLLAVNPRSIVGYSNLAAAALHARRLRCAWAWISRGRAISPDDRGLRTLRRRLLQAMIVAPVSVIVGGVTSRIGGGRWAGHAEVTKRR
jgi:tetratricopeptide (TPR) repeat protein